jgi:hypothetical protein
MERGYNWAWVESEVSATIAEWQSCRLFRAEHGPRFSPADQQRNEDAYDQALRTVERGAKQARRTGSERMAAQRRIVAVFPPFASVALGLEEDAVHLLTHGFFPIGTQFAQWARRFDPNLSMADTIQACRNAWTVCGIQPLLGDRMQMTPSILGYSLLYPYSDNYLDSEKVPAARKLEFSSRFRDRLCGLPLAPRDRHESAVWAMVRLIEVEFPRPRFPRVYECLLAIHQAQENSMAQLKYSPRASEAELLRLSCAKGDTSVLADACLSHGFLSDDEARFAFDWGVLLQLGDDLQDVQDDLKHGAATLFSRAAAAGLRLDNLVRQLLVFSERVADKIEQLPHGDPALKRLLRSSWRSLILMAVARSHRFFSHEFLAEFEPASQFRFRFLRARHKMLAGRRGLYKVLFDSFLDSGEADICHLPQPEDWLACALDRNCTQPPQAVVGEPHLALRAASRCAIE